MEVHYFTTGRGKQKPRFPTWPLLIFHREVSCYFWTVVESWLPAGRVGLFLAALKESPGFLLDPFWIHPEIFLGNLIYSYETQHLDFAESIS
jgi:hypothetical protein